MTKRTILCGASFAVLGLSATLFSTSAFAQDAPAATDVEEVVVTGSLIAGTPENAALPVDVIGSEEIARQGSPSTIDLVKSIPSVAGIAGETNQFLAGQSTGTSNVNLRGLGPLRTLVLLNGHRLAPSPAAGIGIDTNLLPPMIGRVEVLRDGAAATYGSEAIGGVVNFITRTNLEGFEVNAAYNYIPGSDGDYNVSIAHGWVWSGGNAMVVAGYRHRSELDTLDRDFAIRPLDENPGGSWSSFGSPGAFYTSPTLSVASGFVDPACNALGNVARTSLTGRPTCYFQFGRYNNLVEDENHVQFYGQVNLDVTDTIRFHMDALYANHDVPHEGTSPSYAPVQGPSAAVNGVANGLFVIPVSNPGLSALLPFLTPAQQTAINNAGAVYTAGLFWRPYGAGGNPLTGDGAKADRRFFDGLRVSGDLTGRFDVLGGIGWTASLTYGVNRADISTPDIVVSRLGAALRGLGGPGCDTNPALPGVQGGVAGVGACSYFNPFSTGIPSNRASGEVNSLTYQAGTTASQLGATNAAMADWLFEDYAYRTRSTIVVGELVFNGQLPIDFGGGRWGWAAGGQYRYSAFERKVNDISNVALNPCSDEGFQDCAPALRNGALSFFGPLSNQNFNSDVYALFAELQAPITDAIQFGAAIRYEDYGGNVGSTTNPQLRAKWEITPWFALRGSVGSTFRAPPQAQLLPDATTNLTFTTEAGGYRPYDTFGNPNLRPETADTYNIGFLIDAGPFRASVDYFSFDFTDPIGTESGTRMVSTLVANACTGLPAAFLARFTPTNGIPFGPGQCSAANIARTRVNTVNGSGIQTSGIDASAEYRFENVWDGTLRIGTDVSWLRQYDAGAQVVEGVQVRPAGDFVGALDLTLGSHPEWKGSAYAEYSRGAHNLRWTVRYVGDLFDTRNGQYGGANIFAANGSGVPTTNPGNVVSAGATIAAFVTHDVVYRVQLPHDTSLSLSAINVFDEDPPFARLDLSYDPFTANPLGRNFRISLTSRF